MKGSISFTTILIIGFILLVFGISITNMTLDVLNESKNYINYSIAKVNSDTCFEEALIVLRYNQNFTGTASININNGTCTYLVSNDGNPMYKTINTTGSINDANYSKLKKIDISTRPMGVLNP